MNNKVKLSASLLASSYIGVGIYMKQINKLKNCSRENIYSKKGKTGLCMETQKSIIEFK